MGEDLAPVVRRIESRFRDLSVDVRGERVIRYVVKQLYLGRHIDDVMGDAYLLSHTTEVGRAQILQNPTVIGAIEHEISQQFLAYRSATKPTTGDAEAE